MATVKRLTRVLANEKVWPPPIWLMRQAGRYLPEYREIRAKAGDFLALATNPALAAEVTLQPIRRFGLDAAIIFSDILLVPWALGQGLVYAAGEGPQLPPIRNRASVEALDLAMLPGRIAPIQESLRLVKSQLDEQALICFAGAPFTVACYMIEGGGSKDFNATRSMAHGHPALFDALMQTVETATIAFLSAQIEAGADVAMLFDSWAGILSPRLFRRHVTEPAIRIVAALRARHPDTPLIGFPRLAGTMIGDYAERTGFNAVAMDTGSDPAVVRRLVPEGIALQGNLDPLALLAGGETMRAETAGLLDAMRGRPFVFNLGHGIVPQTPPEHVAQLVAQVRAA